MERIIKYEPRYPWMDMAIGDHFVPSKDLKKVTMTTLAAKANAKFKPMRFSSRTTKGRWEIRRVA